jgi:DNA-binding protein HU-beta
VNKQDLVKTIAEKTGLTQGDAAKFLDSFVKVTIETLAKGEEISLVSFGSFSRVERSARIGRDFKTGKSINVTAHRTVRFKPGKGMKNAVT